MASMVKQEMKQMNDERIEFTKNLINVLDTNLEVMKYTRDLRAVGNIAEIEWNRLEDKIYAVHKALIELNRLTREQLT
jgi:hypothetical protein